MYRRFYLSIFDVIGSWESVGLVLSVVNEPERNDKLSTMNIVHVLIEVCSFWTLSSLCNVLFTLFSNFGLCGLFTLFTKNLIKHHQISSNIFKHYQTSSNIIKHHQISSNIIKLHQTSSEQN